MSDERLVEATNINRVYGEEEVTTTALHPTSLQIDRGEFIAIMGPSGSGKSTLLHILGLLDRPTAGTYKFAGQNTERLTEAELAHLRNRTIGFVFQAFHLLPRTSVLDNVALPLQYSGIPRSQHRQMAEEAIQQVQLEHRLEHSPSQLSGGEKQRCAIARALVAKPQVLMADEPTGNLDSKSGQVVMDIIEKLHGAGMTVMVITHETSIADYAERILRLADGKVIADETHHQTHRHVYK